MGPAGMHRDCCSQSLLSPWQLSTGGQSCGGWGPSQDQGKPWSRQEPLCCSSPTPSAGHTWCFGPSPSSSWKGRQPQLLQARPAPWPVCPAQGAETGNERGDRPIKEKEDMALLCLPGEAPAQHPSAPAQNSDAAHLPTACCLLEAQLLADSKPRGSLPFGREKLQFVSFQISQGYRPAVQAPALPPRLSEPWGTSLPTGCCQRDPGGHTEMHSHQHKGFGERCFSDTLEHWRALEILVCSLVWSFGQLYTVSGIAVIKKQNLTSSLV